MQTLFSLHLKGNPLKSVEGPFIRSPSLCDLYLEYCNITRFSRQYFTKLEVLEKLDLTGNPLKNIESGTFDSLDHLIILTLNNCSLAYIYPEAFKGLKSLEILEMHGNRFKSNVDWSLVFRPLSNMLHLDNANSEVSNLDENAFFNNTLLRTLILAENDLSNVNLAATFGTALGNLLYLDVSYCNLKGPIPEDTFVNTEELLVLKLSGNRIFNSHLAAAISRLNKLLSLSLDDCGLITLPNNTFNKLTSLKVLDISRNPLNTAYTEVFLLPLTSLETLDLGHCELRTIKNTMLSKMCKLKTLVLSGNKLRNVEKGFFENLKSLNVLELNDCGLSSLVGTIFHDDDNRPLNVTDLKLSENPLRMPVAAPILPNKLPNLTSLDLSKCNLTFVSRNFFQWSSNIKRLYLNNNKMKNYQDSLHFLDILDNLELLDLSYNAMRSIHPTQLVRNSRLVSLKLYGNPWLCSCGLVDMWDWAASISIGWLEGGVKSNTNETAVRLICYYDPTFALADQLPPLPGQPYNETMSWERFVYYSDCEWRAIEARSVSSRVSREVREQQQDTSATEQPTTVFAVVQGVCLVLLIFTLAFVMSVLFILFSITCKVLLALFCRHRENVRTPSREDDEQCF